MAVDGGNSDDEELDGLMSRGVLRRPTRFSTASVGGVQERVHRAAASRERANVGRRSVAGRGNAEEYDSEAMPGVTPIGSMTRDKGIAPNYESIEPQLEIAPLKHFIDGTTPAPPAHAVALVTQFREMQLLTFTTISLCCSPTVQIALKACRMKVDAGFQVWQFIMRTYMAKDDLYIGQLEQALTNLEMGEHESATSYCNRAQQILVNLRMAGVDYSQASMLKLPQVRMELDEDTLANYIIEEECTLASEGRKDQFLPQANQRADKEADKGGEGSRGSSASGKGGDGSKGSGQSSCAMVKPVREHPPPIMLEPEAGEGLQAVAAAVKANPSIVPLDSGCSQHLMGDRSAFVEMSSGGSIKHDRKTWYIWAYPLAKKSDALAAFQKWLPMAERQCKTTVKALRTDRGGEFLGHDFTLFLDKKGIIHDLTCPYTPEQNGMAEREIRSIVEAVRTLLLHMGVQHHWWHLALSQAVWVRNRVEHASLSSGVTPYELSFRRKPDVGMVRVWGCMLQYMVPQSQRGGKLAPKARWGLHLGVSAASKGWQVLDLESNRLITTVEAIFYETMSLAGWKAWH
ncbi:unnamed protein product [Closterium sp. NIES-53]